MKYRRLAVAALSLPLATPAFAADCRPDPLAGRTLYLRGTFNDWRADDETALRYACDHYELVAQLKGQHSFKVGDEDWSDDVNLGAAGAIPHDLININGTLFFGATDGIHGNELWRSNGTPAGTVLVTTLYGGSRIVDMLVGDPLPRIC